MKLLLLFTLFSMSGCGVIQIAEIKSPNVTAKDNAFEFNNDTLRITYDFWAPQGILAFKIHNKLSVPIYIDWGKSSCVYKGNKLDYWVDLSYDNSLIYYGNFLYKGQSSFFNATPTTSSLYNTQIAKQERITFIPPGAEIVISKFVLVPIDRFNMDNVKQDKKGNKTIDISYEQARYKFRNFLTYSVKENISPEQYVDNEFYVGKVSELRAGNGEVVKENYPVKTPQRFYIAPSAQ